LLEEDDEAGREAVDDDLPPPPLISSPLSCTKYLDKRRVSTLPARRSNMVAGSVGNQFNEVSAAMSR
jgi:hypothetical protein